MEAKLAIEIYIHGHTARSLTRSLVRARAHARAEKEKGRGKRNFERKCFIVSLFPIFFFLPFPPHSNMAHDKKTINQNALKRKNMLYTSFDKNIMHPEMTFISLKLWDDKRK